MDGNHVEAGVTGPILHFFCGEIASGNSTLAARLAAAPGTVSVGKDAWNAALWPSGLKTTDDHARCVGRLRKVMGPHVAALLSQGLSVVLDFQPNDLCARSWMRGLIEASDAAHRLHPLEVENAECPRRLAMRDTEGAHEFMASEAESARLAGNFRPPHSDEGFFIQRSTPC